MKKILSTFRSILSKFLEVGRKRWVTLFFGCVTPTLCFYFDQGLIQPLELSGASGWIFVPGVHGLAIAVVVGLFCLAWTREKQVKGAGAWIFVGLLGIGFVAGSLMAILPTMMAIPIMIDAMTGKTGSMDFGIGLLCASVPFSLWVIFSNLLKLDLGSPLRLKALTPLVLGLALGLWGFGYQILLTRLERHELSRVLEGKAPESWLIAGKSLVPASTWDPLVWDWSARKDSGEKERLDQAILSLTGQSAKEREITLRGID